MFFFQIITSRPLKFNYLNGESSIVEFHGGSQHKQKGLTKPQRLTLRIKTLLGAKICTTHNLVL